MKHRLPNEPIRMAFIHRSERRMREAFMCASHPPMFIVPKLSQDALLALTASRLGIIRVSLL